VLPTSEHFCYFSARDALGAGFYVDNMVGRPRNLWSVIFQISQIAQSPIWPACKELQISEFSASEG
jgi:hypothetical protein